ncbi:O-methyltransferase [Natribacillus halophilus]|uniref:Predicted O-methyltransferase YrrM n=1 Tax=Natribacillus halophilus TaxID=549003 RepID=A0A1G8S2M6_9BACI|nr:class I SAM-dependent methyltransferase [Natribacillus halophilus]SDJ23488.1 Predicted O-methyltransferase YrrM [Natribacillus halophilus]
MEVPHVAEQIHKEIEDIGFTMTCDQETATLLRTLAASKSRGRLLELGTGAGYSTSWILAGMDEESSLITVEVDKKLHQIAKKYLSSDSRVEFVTGDGETFIRSADDHTFDFIFADTWPGKLSALDETLQLLNKGGFYIIDDLLHQEDWPEPHWAQIKALVSDLAAREDLTITKLNWSTGLIIATKT